MTRETKLAALAADACQECGAELCPACWFCPDGCLGSHPCEDGG